MNTFIKRKPSAQIKYDVKLELLYRFPPTNEEPAKTKYHQHLEKTFQEWVGTRESFFRAGVESAGMPLNRSCVVCELRDAVLRCKDCGANHFFCRECGIVNHQHRNKFHYLEQWTVSLHFP